MMNWIETLLTTFIALDFFFITVRLTLFVIHCDAGYSRSPAVAAALALALNGRGADDEFFVKGNYCPNMHVYNTMLKELDARGYFNDL